MHTKGPNEALMSIISFWGWGVRFGDLIHQSFSDAPMLMAV